MSLPLSFSPFDDFDSPYASTNAAIRSRQRQSQTHSPTSSLQQHRQSYGSHTAAITPSQSQMPLTSAADRGTMLEDVVPTRRTSPPPCLPAAEDFGARRHGRSQRASSSMVEFSSSYRSIARPQPFGASLASLQQQSNQSSSASPPWPSPVATTPLVLYSHIQRRPAPSPPMRASSPSASSTRASKAIPKVTQTPPSPSPLPSSRPQVPPSDSKPIQSNARNSWTNRLFGSPRPTPAPVCGRAQVSEPIEVYSQSQADALKSHKFVQTLPSHLNQRKQQQQDTETAVIEMQQTASAAHLPAEVFQSDDDKMQTSHADSSRTLHHSSRELHVGTADVSAGALPAAAIASASRPNSADRSRHAAFDMGHETGCDDSLSDEKTPAAAIAAAAAGSARDGLASNTQWKIGKATNEGSTGRWGGPTTGASADLLESCPHGSPPHRGQSILACPSRTNERRWILGGVIALVFILIATVVGGVVGSKSGSSSSGSTNGRSSGTGTGSAGSPSTTGVGGTKVSPDPRLHNSFYGLNYEPFGTDATSGCTANITAVMEDVKLLSQLTTRIRLAGSLCNETALVLDAITRTKINLTIWAAVTLDATSTTAIAIPVSWTNQINNITYAFNTFGTEQVGGVAVGNEFVTDGGSVSTLVSYIDRFKTLITNNSGWGSIPVATAEVSSEWTQALANAVDVVFANNQAWYSGIAAAEAADWVYGYLQDTVTPLAQAAAANPSVVISEFGWPTAASTTAATTIDEAIASVASLQMVLDTFVCSANKNNTAYFFFEMFDVASTRRSDGVSPYWGLFDSNKQLKNITIPQCFHL